MKIEQNKAVLQNEPTLSMQIYGMSHDALAEFIKASKRTVWQPGGAAGAVMTVWTGCDSERV